MNFPKEFVEKYLHSMLSVQQALNEVDNVKKEFFDKYGQPYRINVQPLEEREVKVPSSGMKKKIKSSHPKLYQNDEEEKLAINVEEQFKPRPRKLSSKKAVKPKNSFGF